MLISGVGEGLGFSTGGGGGSPNSGTWTPRGEYVGVFGVGVGVAVGTGDAPVCGESVRRGRESPGCWARPTWETTNSAKAIRHAATPATARRRETRLSKIVNFMFRFILNE